MKILVTGFKPFLGHDQNPSERLSVELAQNFSEVESLILPVEFGRAFEVLDRHLSARSYDYILLLGQAAGRHRISIEKIGLNWAETHHRDEAGIKPVNGPLVAGAELALMTKFPVDEVYRQLIEQKLPVHVSFSAGTYVCNDIYFRAMERHPDKKIVFIHVPLLPEQKPEFPMNQMGYGQQLDTLESLIQILLKF
ncbi:MAG: pyroglutamyl-peptidase I [Bdellovibrionaceae bacterium]|nr:pyroglutamyl-peptidase I [Pseudobdellovibrionaceae bacterium]